MSVFFKSDEKTKKFEISEGISEKSVKKTKKKTIAIQLQPFTQKPVTKKGIYKHKEACSRLCCSCGI